MSDVLADLYILLRAESGRMVTGFAEGGAAGEEMAATVAAATTQVEASVAAASAAVAGIGEAATETAAVAGAGFDAVGLTAEQLAAKIAVVTADVEAEIVALDASLISIEQAATDTAIANAAAMEKMRTDTIAALTSMEAAEAQAAAATEAMATKIDAAAATSVATTAGKLQALKTGALAVGVVTALVAGGSIKMAADFESSTNRLVTSAGETEANLDGVRQGILQMTSQVGYSAEDLAAAMYKVESGGQHGAAGLDVLKASAQGAKAENADLTTVADAVTSVLQDYHLQASASADVTSKLVAATASGKMTFEELAGSLSSVLPVASANHVALEDVLGDISSMTVHGMSASQVTQNLSDTIRHMAAPTQQQSKELAALGMNAQQLSSDLGENGLYGVIQNISQAIIQRFSPDMQHVVISLRDALSKSTPAVQELGQKLLDGTMSAKQYNTAAKDMDVASQGQAMAFATLVKGMDQLGTAQNGGSQAWQSYTAALRGAMGDATGLNVALMLTGENSKTTADAIGSIRGATADASGNVKGWSEIQSTFNQKMSEAKDGLGALAISIGTYLLPVVSAIAGALATATQWMSQHKAVAEVLAIAVGVGLVIAFSALLAVFWGFAANPVTWIIAGIILVIGLLAVAVYEVISHWSSIVDFFVGLWHGIENIFHTVVDAVVGFVKDWYPLILGVLSGGILLIPALIFKYWSQISAFVATVWNAVVGFLAGVWSSIVSGVVGAWNAVLGAISTVLNAIGSFIVRGFTAIVNATRPIWQPIVTIISNVFQIIWTIVSTVATIIGLFLQAAWRGIVTVATTVFGGLVAYFTASWNLVSGIFLYVWNGIVAYLTAVWNLVSGIATTVWGGIVAYFTAVWNLVSGIFSAGWNGIVAYLTAVWNLVSSIATTVWDFIVGIFRGAWNAISGAVSDGIGHVVSFFSGLASQIWGVISGIGKWLWDAGVNLIEGLLDGIASMTGKLLGKVKQMAQDAVNTVKSWLGIASPSKVFQAEIGVHIPTGVAAGIDAAASEANASARRMALGVLAASKDILGQGATVPVTAAVTGGGAGTAAAYSVAANGAGQGTTHITINLTVQGSVLTEQDLIKAVQDGLLQVGVRNNGNFTSYSGFGGG